MVVVESSVLATFGICCAGASAHAIYLLVCVRCNEETGAVPWQNRMFLSLLSSNLTLSLIVTAQSIIEATPYVIAHSLSVVNIVLFRYFALVSYLWGAVILHSGHEAVRELLLSYTAPNNNDRCIIDIDLEITISVQHILYWVVPAFITLISILLDPINCECSMKKYESSTKSLTLQFCTRVLPFLLIWSFQIYTCYILSKIVSQMKLDSSFLHVVKTVAFLLTFARIGLLCGSFYTLNLSDYCCYSSGSIPLLMTLVLIQSIGDLSAFYAVYYRVIQQEITYFRTVEVVDATVSSTTTLSL